MLHNPNEKNLTVKKKKEEFTSGSFVYGIYQSIGKDKSYLNAHTL